MLKRMREYAITSTLYHAIMPGSRHLYMARTWHMVARLLLRAIALTDPNGTRIIE